MENVDLVTVLISKFLLQMTIQPEGLFSFIISFSPHSLTANVQTTSCSSSSSFTPPAGLLGEEDGVGLGPRSTEEVDDGEAEVVVAEVDMLSGERGGVCVAGWIGLERL